MKAKEVQEQLDSLRKEIREMSSILHRIQEEDVRRVYGEQIRSVLNERSHRFFEAERGRLRSGEDGWLHKVEETISMMIEETVTTYQMMDQDKALTVLEEHSSRPWPSGPRDSVLRCHGFMDDVIDQFKRYFTISIGWRGQIGLLTQAQDCIGTGSVPLSPELVERVLSPLSNPIRFGVMTSLRVKGRGLTEMGRELGLQKGHLQFHMRALVDAGYLVLDRRTHLYSLTPRGDLALRGVEDLVRSMGMGP
jgi:hypothetical protein